MAKKIGILSEHMYEELEVRLGGALRITSQSDSPVSAANFLKQERALSPLLSVFFGKLQQEM